MTRGTLVVSYFDNSQGAYVQIDCGIVTTVDDNIRADVLVTPIVVYNANNAFAFDTGATENLSFSILRRNPPSDVIDDSSPNSAYWSNHKWKLAISGLIDRWQARTDGCTLRFTPVVLNGQNGVYQEAIEVNAYIRSLTITYDVSSLELLRVTLDAAVGSMGAEMGP